jgi:hypothetical protein
MIYEPLKINHCLFAKLLVLKNVQVTNMARSLQSFDKFQHQAVEFQLNCFLVIGCIIFTFSSYEYLTRRSSCEIHTLF